MLLRYLEQYIARVVREDGAGSFEDLEFEHRSYDANDFVVDIRLRFRSRDDFFIRLPRDLIREVRSFTPLDEARFGREFSDLYWRLYEDEHVGRQVRECARHVYDQIQFDPTSAQPLLHGLQEFERHVRENHRRVPSPRSPRDRETFRWERRPGRSLTAAEIAARERAAVDREQNVRWSDMMTSQVEVLSQSAATAEMQRHMRDFMDRQAAIQMWAFGPELDSAAEQRGMELLKSRLSSEQLKQFEKHHWFVVRGSDTGKHYVIKEGRQMNIEELDRSGKPVKGWCFLPQGGLCTGDTILAQKISLETRENKALKVANRFGVGWWAENDLAALAEAVRHRPTPPTQRD